MNKYTYRLVFNESRGCLMAVAETAVSQGKSGRGERANRDRISSGGYGAHRILGAVALACKLASQSVMLSAAVLGLVPVMQAQAQTPGASVATRIVADPTAARSQQATILNSANGVVQVNIQTPSAAGVSRNTYSQFDVGQQGAILNNSRTNVQTQLGGWVQGNPWLAAGSARVIVNEVNSSNPSTLQGYVEAAGQKAEVIIANPSGIAINGGGFINATGVTLTTGTPMVNNGNLESYRVQRGLIQVDGAGLDTRNANYTAILSRAVQINAGIWAQQLQVVTGANQIEAHTLGSDSPVQAQALPGAGTTPAYALDVGQLGGMYAGKIMLIGTEAGLGVRNAGLVQAANGPLTLTQEGWLSNSGTLQAAGGDVQIQTRGTVEQSGTVYSKQNVQLTSQANQSHSGTTAALGNVNIEASGANSDSTPAQIQASNSTVWAAGLQSDGQLTGQQNLNVKVSGRLQTAGQALATSALNLQGASLDLSQSSQQATTLKLQANSGDLKATGSQLLATDQLQITTPQALITDGAKVQAAMVSLTANSLSNVAGQIVQTGSTDQTMALHGGLDNTAGVIQSAANNLNLSAQTIDNTAGQLLHAGSGAFQLSSHGRLLNNSSSSAQAAVTDGARIVSMGSLNISSPEVDSSGSVYAAKDLTTQASSLNNSGSMYAAGRQSLTLSGALTNSGTIATAKDLSVNATSVAGTSSNVLAAGMAADGILSGTGALSLSTTGASQSAGQLLATGNVSLSSASLDLSNSTTGSTTGGVSLLAKTGNILTQSAQVSTPGALSITANGAAPQTLNNTGGQLSGQQLSIQVGQLNNTQGVIHQTGTGAWMANIQSAGAVTNTAGTILANAQDLTFSAGAAITNTDGYIGHAGSGTFTLSTAATDNTRGRILGNAALTFNATGFVDNTSGLVAAKSLSAQATGWNNNVGKLVSTQGILSLNTTQNPVTNTQGLIQSAQDLILNLAGDANSLHNSVGKIMAARDASISTGQLTNHAGLISAQGALNITSSGGINNAANNGQASQIYSGGDLKLQAAGLDNTASQVLAVGNATVTLGSGNLSNTMGLMRVGQSLTVQAASVDNTHTRAFNSDNTPQAMGLEGNSIAINTANLNNSQGAVRAAQDLNIYSDGQLSNDQGELSAGGKLQITNAQANIPSLRTSNQAGQIVADQSVNVRTGSLSGAGTLSSKGDVTVSLQGDHTLAGSLQAGGNLSLSATGQITNPISVQVGKNLSVTANKLDNQVTGELLSGQTTQITIADTLTNRGLIDGPDTRVQAGTVNNLGTGRIYGDRLAMAADTLINQAETVSGVTTAATMAGRERVDLGVQTLTNREDALIYSGGDMALGGALDAAWRSTGSAQTVNNNSATIEAARNLMILATSIRNSNEHFASELRQVSQTNIIEYQGSGAPQRYKPGDPDVYTYYDQSLYLRTPDGNYEQWVEYSYTRTVQESVVTQSSPGKILAGAGISLTATNVINDKSQIVAGGALTVQAISLNNLQAQGTKITTDAGVATSYWRNRRKGTDNTGSSATEYAPPSVGETTTLSALRYEQNTVNASTASVPAASTMLPVAAQASATGQVMTNTLTNTLSTVAGTQAGLASGHQVPQSIAAQSGSTQTLIRTAQPSAQLPGTSLYKIHPEIQAKFLVETDPQFTQYKTWLGSDYMLQALNLDPSATQKRLGDGFYEQKLVRDQVLALTGQRFLGNYTSDDAQYRALMNAGITQAQTLKLRPGIALSAEQAAQLTSDMVWLVTKEVTLADGSRQSVLVPQVYVRVKPGDLDGSGALLAGADVSLNLGGDMSNSGTIAGRNLVQINAQSIRNLGGQMNADTLALQASQYIDNIGGQMKAQSAALLSAGRDLNLSTTTQSSINKVGNNSFARTGIDRVAGLYVSGPAGVLLANAGNNINLSAAKISNAGTGVTALDAANSLNIGTVTTQSSQDLNWSRVNYLRQSSSRDVGSDIQAAGLLSFKAGQDLNAKAANVNAGQALSVSAGNSINIIAGQASQSLDTANTVTSRGVLSSKTTTTRTSSQSTTAVGSSFEGQSLSLSAGQDLALQGSNIIADQNVALQAGGNVAITAAQNTSSQSSFSQTTRRGLMSGGGLSITIGTQQQSLDQKNQQTTAAASTVGSTGGSVTIRAGQGYTQTGSDVLTPAGTIDISAKTVDINEARETGSQSTDQRFRQGGVSVGLTGGMIDTLQATTQALQGAAGSGSGRSQALNALIAYGKGADLYGQGKAVTNAADKNGVMGKAGDDGKPLPGATAASGIKVSVSVGSASSQSNSNTTSDTAAGSSVKAGGNVNIKATEGDLTVQGSHVQAAQYLALAAQNNVNIVASVNTESSRSTNKSSSTSVGVSFGIGQGSSGLSVDVAASRGKGQANSDSITYNNSHVTAGQQVSITSGADTNIAGGNVTAQQVTANVSGNLNVQSLQDVATSNASQRTTGVSLSIPVAGGGGNLSVSTAQQKSNSNYQSVGEQSGIQAGAGGFDITVKGNTDLKGVVIASNADTSKNSLSTGTLTTSDLENRMSASASSSGTSLGTGMLSGKYELAKAAAGNALNQGAANQSDASTTRTAISWAQVTVGGKTTDTSKDSLTDSNGKPVSSDNSATNRTLAKADVAGLQQQAQQQQADNNLVFKAATAFTDPAFKAAFLDQAKMYKKIPTTDDKGNASFEWKEMSPEEKAQIPPGSRIANNGIFNGGPNDPSPAQNLAQQNSSGEAQYLVHFPQANNLVSELLVAGYQKFLEGGTMDLTNATQQNVDLWNQTGGNITLDGHSRGGMTVGNALTAVQEQGGKGGATNVNLFGSAYNAQDAASTVNQITNGQGQVQQSTNNYDFIGRILGGNAGTGGKIPEGSSVLEEVIRTMGGTATVHNCYGAGNENCRAPSRFGPDYVAPLLVPVLPSGAEERKP